MPDIIVIGEALVDLFAEEGFGIADAPSFSPHCGGAPFNVAVRAAQLGSQVRFAGRVGRDPFGRLIRDTLNRHGVSTLRVVDDPQKTTMIAFVSLRDPNKPEFMLIPGANVSLASVDVPDHAMSDARLLAFGSITLAYDSRNAAMDIACRSRACGLDVVFDVNHRPNIWSSEDQARLCYREAIRTSNIVKLNAEEARFLTGEANAVSGARRLLEQGPLLVCLTLGADGCHMLTRQHDAYCAGHRVDVVDATGCGDAFLAGICSYLSKHPVRVAELTPEQLAAMGEYANACGAIAATQKGAIASALSSDIVQTLLSRKGKD